MNFIRVRVVGDRHPWVKIGDGGGRHLLPSIQVVGG